MTVAERIDVAAMRLRLEKAEKAVADMCDGSRRWRMSIPVDMERDHDMVIGSALNDLKALLDREEPT